MGLSSIVAFCTVLVLLVVVLRQRRRIAALAARLSDATRTDPLTGLLNRGAFEQLLDSELERSRRTGRPVAGLVADVDGLAQVNARSGHPAGDAVLQLIARDMQKWKRRVDSAGRLGGDEFALLLPGVTADEALATASSVLARIGALQLPEVGSVTASAGVAGFPRQAFDRDELIRLADSALYWAKEHGKNRVHVYRPDVVELAELRRLAHGPDRAARFRAAASLAKAVDARDTYTGSHSTRVAELAAWIAQRLGLDQEHVELTRLAGSLHDLGKLAIPEEILRKPGPLAPPERLVLERHPQIGHRMLESLGVDPVADWVLHHHERWDGTGYPNRLRGDEIPLGARIVFVADAYDAMTSDRAYRGRLTPGEAVDELVRCAGTQFDPEIIAVFARELLQEAPAAVAAAR
jgi:diguanylate cyclase (GGDEF)-like protein/putative nucleotidyltransferase with HDIG domain